MRSLSAITHKKNPRKSFVYVPHKKKMRNKWLNLARRDPKAISLNTTIYFCEDHFNIRFYFIDYKMVGA